MVSTGSAAHAWASDEAPDGAVVVAGHQLSPRGHAGRPLSLAAGRGLGFSLVLRPDLPAEREGWLYTLLLVGLADTFGPEATIRWPDEVVHDGAMVATVGVTTRLQEGGLEWAIADVMVPLAEPPRAELLGRLLDSVDARADAPASEVQGEYERRCTTIGERVRARLRAGTGPSLEGTGTATLDDGALVLETADGRKAAVRPQDVRRLERV